MLIAPSTPNWTELQGQYLAFIYAYTMVLGRPPAEADVRNHFGVTSPTVHQMILGLESSGWITRQARAARSIRILVDPALLPALQPSRQPIKTTVPRY